MRILTVIILVAMLIVCVAILAKDIKKLSKYL